MDKNLFTSSLCLENHPMRNVKQKIKEEYYYVLSYFIEQAKVDDIGKYRLELYKNFLVKNNMINLDIKIEELISSIVICRFQPWRKKYRYWLLCDIALILLNEVEIQNIAMKMKSYISKRQQKQFEVLISALMDEKIDTTLLDFAEDLIEQYHKNIKFFLKQERRYVVTANMSAGKSTLINALIGKPLARTSQEVCTGNICYIYNKSFEDGHIHLENDKLNLNANQKDLTSFEWDVKTNIASYFRGIEKMQEKICIIDTPGVNSAMNRKHGRITREVLTTEKYDKVLYVLNANKLGTDEEIAYLKWISKNVPKDKVIFILNKLDDFNSRDDSIDESINGVYHDLIALGYENPIICPMSAYFALLIKMKYNEEDMTVDEIDEYELYLKKFSRSMYDLSKYYDGVQENAGDSQNIQMSKKCGLYGLEKILFGGIS